MTNEELQKIIDQLDENGLKQEAVFGIFNYGAGSGESFIKANKEGLRLFAAELLKSAKKVEEVLPPDENNIIPFDYNGDWIDENSATFIQYVQPVSGKQFTAPQQKAAIAVSNRLVLYAWIIGIIILLAAIVVGFITIFKWLF
ncbi:MAG: hypothetical protein QM763_23830 [Agriterribacter sp.]